MTTKHLRRLFQTLAATDKTLFIRVEQAQTAPVCDANNQRPSGLLFVHSLRLSQ